MSDAQRRFLSIILVGAAACAASAAGAGGIFFNLVQPSWNPEFLPAANSLGVEYFGGSGYGVSRDGVIVGGFGMAILDYDIYLARNWSGDQASPQHLAGGIGGLLVGSRVFSNETIHLDLAARLGAGGLALSTRRSYEYEGETRYTYDSHGYAVLYAEPYVELGIGITPWMHLCATLSYQLFGNFIPGKPFAEFAYNSPAIGCAISFGEFRR